MQFEPLPLLSPHVGLFWSELRDRYPKVEQKIALEPVIERFGGKPIVSSAGGFRLLEDVETPRCWFLTEDETELLQLQGDRLIHNWRKRTDTDRYPRFEHVRDSFLEESRRFAAFVERESLGQLSPNQCEVTYINHIFPSGVWEKFGQVDSAFVVWSSIPLDGFLPPPEEVRFNMRFVIPGYKNEPSGRLHVNLQPAYVRQDGQEVFSLNLTARGAPVGPGLDGVAMFLETGREWITKAFAEITSPALHRVWGRHA